MNSFTHWFYRTMLYWYVTVYRPTIKDYRPYLTRFYTGTHHLGRYSLYPVFYWAMSEEWKLSHIVIRNNDTGQEVTEQW